MGKMFVSMISLILEIYYNNSLIKTMEELATRHIKYGVELYHFYIMGNVILSTFAEILDDEFTEERNTAWKKIYSQMLRIIIPIMKDKDNKLIETINKYKINTIERNEKTQNP